MIQLCCNLMHCAILTELYLVQHGVTYVAQSHFNWYLVFYTFRDLAPMPPVVNLKMIFDDDYMIYDAVMILSSKDPDNDENLVLLLNKRRLLWLEGVLNQARHLTYIVVVCSVCNLYMTTFGDLRLCTLRHASSFLSPFLTRFLTRLFFITVTLYRNVMQQESSG